MSIHEDDYHDEVYNSEDTESTLSGDLDYELSVEVLLPNNTTQKVTIPANTPWGDLRARLCSQFKLSPSTHVVDFISSSPSSHKRRTSLAIGKMNISLITIKKKQQVKHVAPPPPVRAVNAENRKNTERGLGSVRLIVRLPQSRQSILRVNPDAPLSSVIENISDKLKLSEESKKQVEFLHPSQHGVTLKSDLSLNHYRIREVFLAEKRAPSTPSRGKKKAPPPPRPPPPVITPKNKSSSSDDLPIPKKDSSELEPIYAQVRKPPKPAKRRTAPALPNASSSSRSDPVSDNFSGDADDNQKANKAPVKAPRRLRGSHEALEEKSTSESSDHDVARQVNMPTKKNLIIDDESDPYATIDDDAFGEEEVDGVDPEDALASIEEVLESDDEKDVSGEMDAIHSIDDVLNDLADEEKTQSSGDDEVHVVDDEVHVSDDEITRESPNSLAIEGEQRKDQTRTENFDDTVMDVNDETPKKDDSEDEGNSDDENDTEDVSAFDAPAETDDLLPPSEEQSQSLPDFDFLPSNRHPLESRDGSASPVDVTPEVETIEPDQVRANVEKVKPSETIQPPSLVDAEQNTKDIPFDLHIAESFSIPTQSIDELHKPVEVKRKAETIDQPAKSLPFKVNGKSHIPTKKEVKPELTDIETEKEIEKLHKQIKMMKSRKNLKQKDANANVNSWQTGTFTFVPNSNRRLSHDDYEIAPVGGIELSNSGEMKPLNQKQDKKADTPPVQTEEVAHSKTRPTLPSYYKKLLGVQAFDNHKAK